MLLVDSVLLLGLQDVGVREPVIEKSEAGAQNGFRGLVFSTAKPPRESKARREIAMRADIVLRLDAKASAQVILGRTRQSSWT